jgi:hypothetical protein
MIAAPLALHIFMCGPANQAIGSALAALLDHHLLIANFNNAKPIFASDNLIAFYGVSLGPIPTITGIKSNARHTPFAVETHEVRTNPHLLFSGIRRYAKAIIFPTPQKSGRR